MYYILYLEALSGGPSWVFSINQSINHYIFHVNTVFIFNTLLVFIVFAVGFSENLISLLRILTPYIRDFTHVFSFYHTILFLCI